MKNTWCRASTAACTFLLTAVSALCPAQAYEADVHYGLTKWLAIKAGFDESQAEAIAVGNQRIDSGLMDTLEVVLEVACVGHFVAAARDVQLRHYPSAAPVPSAPADRKVSAGGAAAHERIKTLLGQAAGKEGLLLGLFGGALHTLQDSWSHAGVPGVPALGAGLACDATLASGHAADRGGANAHDADLTHRYPADVLPMAQATYEALAAYPAVQSRQRDAAPWAEVADAIGGFATARTKSGKRNWFVVQGLASTGFLAGTSLPDGEHPGPMVFHDRRLPPLKGPGSTQFDAAADVKEFFDRLIARWLGNEPVDRLVAELAGAAPSGVGGSTKKVAKLSPGLRDLAMRMKLWKLRDHGSAAALAHAAAPLNAAQWRAAQRLTQDPAAFVGPVSPALALFPLLAKGEHVSPLLPYIVRDLPTGSSGLPRVIAIARLVHAPYDTVGWIAERKAQGWVLTAMVSAVDQ